MTRPTRAAVRGHVALVTVCVILVTAFLVLPDGSLAQATVLVGSMVAAAVIVVTRLSRTGAITSLPWSLLAIAVVLYAALMAVWTLAPLLSERAAIFGHGLDALFLLSFLIAGAFLVCILERRYSDEHSVRRPIVVVVVDAAIAAIAITSVIWLAISVFGAVQRPASAMTGIAAVAYILATTMLLSIAVRLVASTAWRSTAAWLLLGWVGFIVVADVTYGYLTLSSGFSAGHPVAAAWILSAVLLAGAAWQDDFDKLDQHRAAFTEATWNVWLPLAVALLPLAIVLVYRTPLVEMLAGAAIVLNIVRLRLMFLDLSHQRQVANELGAAVDELETANRSLGHFASVVSHDLRSPLATVHSLLNTLAMRSNALNDDERLLIERATTLTAKQLETIEALLTLSRTEQRPIEQRPIDLGGVVDDVLSALHNEIEEQDAQIVVDDLPSVNGDVALLRILFQNLVANALKFRHPDRNPHITIRAHRKNDAWHVEVSDNGRSFDPVDAEVIFELFGRSHQGYQVPGSGIGLATCRRIAQQHGGTITAHGRDDGATFVVTLPATHGSAATASDTAAKAAKTS